MRWLFEAIAPGGDRGRLSVLIFHRVLAASDPLRPDEFDARQFDVVCEWLRRWFNVLPLDAAVRRLADRSLPRRSLAITFDDGYADNHDVALPILLRHGLSATFFIATGFLDGGRMWNDTVIEAVRKAPGDRLDLEDVERAGLTTYSLGSADARRNAIAAIIEPIKYLPPAQRKQVVDCIATKAGAVLPDDLMLRSKQVIALRRAGMQIGAHTVTHPILATLAASVALDEMMRSKRQLEALIQERVQLFAYPNGRPNQDYNAQTVPLARVAGFDAAVTTAWGAASVGTDRFQIPRFTPWDRTRVRFGLRLMHTIWASRKGVAVGNSRLTV